MRIFILLVFTLICASIKSQVIRGTVKDVMLKEPLISATIVIEGLEGKFAVTDVDGNFIIRDIPIGRYSVKVSYVGYRPTLLSEIAVSASKETVLDIGLEELDNELSEVVVKPGLQKQKALNPMAMVGSRMFSVEEASRYAGGFDDPARLAASYSGIANTGTQNGISIHGNSPHLVQWHIEGIEMPAPNHVSDAYYEGGGVISALSSQVMGNSDFLSAAFPAEYGNALSGVFDVKLRNGNTARHEHTVQVGLLGIEGASEGPISKKHGSTYILNYRYSTLGIAADAGVVNTGDILKYQDVNFKLNFPTKHAGTFSLFGIGWIDHAYVDIDDPEEWECIYDQENTDVKQYSFMGGLSHKMNLGKNGHWETTMAYSHLKSKQLDNYTLLNDFSNVNSGTYIHNSGKMKDVRNAISVATNYNLRVMKNVVWKAGLNYSFKSFDYDLALADYVGAKELKQIKSFSDDTSLFSAFSEVSWNANSYFTVNGGLYAQYLAINKKKTLEPRLSMRWRMDDDNSLSFGYANQSMIDRMDCLFENRDLGFMRSNQFMMTFSHNFSETLNFKVEGYLQLHYDVPVGIGDEAAYSVLNRFDYYEDHRLVNGGKGRTYGIDFTLEKYMSHGYYYQANASFFKSEYRGGDKVWHNTRFNRDYVLKALAGKEWYVGRKRQNVLNVSAKISYMGGLRYSPINEEESRATKDYEVVYDESDAFSKQLDADMNIDLTVSYKINKKTTSHEIALKWLNLTNQGAYMKHVYNYKTDKFEPYDLKYTFPNLSYKFCF